MQKVEAILIPKTLHYAWFGGMPKPPVIQACIDSFHRIHPDYEIIEWNERTFDINAYPFARHAAAHGKWAFVADVCRAHVFMRHGGFFLDGDNELTARIDAFRGFTFVSGFENFFGNVAPITALMGSIPGSPIAQFMHDYYRSLEDFSFKPNTSFLSVHLQEAYEFAVDNTLQLRHGVLLCPSWFFCTPVAGFPNYCIHHFEGSWK
jgi:mannosyltransferase OCH1-like enzyme